MTSTATISSSARKQNQRKKTIAITSMQEIRKRTLDGAVAFQNTVNERYRLVNENLQEFSS